MIESEEERREVAERERARKASQAQVNWEVARDPSRQPALRYFDADGCDNLFVYGWSEDRTETIALQADRDLLQLSTTPRIFDPVSQHLELTVYVYERPVGSQPFCTNRIVGGTGEKAPELWRAVTGKIAIEVSPPGVRARDPQRYRATIRITDTEFVNDAGVRVKQTQPITLRAIVGGRN